MENSQFYLFIRGPLLWVAFVIFIGGIIFRTLQFFRLTQKKPPLTYSPIKNHEERYGKSSTLGRKMQLLVELKNSFFGQNPVVALVTLFFHILLFIIPIFLLAHNLLWYESWGIKLLSFSESTGNILTIIFLTLALFLLLRRLVVAEIRALTGKADYFVWVITVAPFLTGLICYQQWFNYQISLMIHILCGEFMLIAITFTKLGHMIFFFLARFFVSSEYTLGPGTRIWK